ncbi:restriction endonuclease subunit S [Atlantibacter hermannii]|uniref:Type I restriction enzyme S protein n=1 Tax=Atlantibacter hermannii NBRC 105704 TaxID=1115512 RepID=H5V803_ATLHE|nr:restriction endonuclease subunit S [Atlantibacter hermannii]MDU7814290.1 restriction endonuclease subunit S [Atlantibacter hermannii]QPS91208.1 restriction endonuclease subunit S [Atlantibacter hermannii]GAB54111.1 type I restriction enzyme S protein [Atlantibacter hermannii NBRC 105704]VDZ71715.1 type I restriction modification DNA specificity domain-containing protein [Atlantibacter hermannii]
MNFDEYSFADLLSNIVDNRGKTCPVEDEGFPLIATNCIKDDSLYPVFEKVRFVSDDTYKNWFRDHPNAGDIIFVCKGSPGRVAWVKEPVSFCIAQDMVAIRADQKVVDPMFLFSLLRSEQVINKINNMHVGTLIPHFKKGDFKNLYLSIPRDLKLQRAIGLFYFSLSEKIEKNKEINQTLEQMAQALFKSWFVDFEPVKTKIAVLEAGGSQEDATLAAMTAISGKDADALVVFEREQPEQYAELKATAELFPSAMQESELGEIPEGWELSSLSEKIKLIGGGTPKRSEPEFWNGDICWYSVKDAPADSDVFVIDTTEKITKKGLDKSSAKLLPIGTTIISARGTVGKLALTATEMAMNQSCYGISGGEFSGPLLTYLKVKQCVDVLKRNTHGAVFDTITTSTFDTVVTLTASKIVNHRFEKIVTPLFNDIENNLRTNASLTQLRDTLLPKLLSGEITLPEAEQAVSEAENV